jgi:hypothetical protein
MAVSFRESVRFSFDFRLYALHRTTLIRQGVCRVRNCRSRSQGGRAVLDYGAGRIRAEIVTAFPVVFRPDRSGAKTSSAIRADIVEDVLDAGTAEGAFKGANHRVR